MATVAEDKSTAAELNLNVVLSSLARYVQEHFGSEKLEEMLEASGLKSSDLKGATRWGTVEQVGAFYAQAYALLGRDDQAFIDANAYKMAESIGPIRYALRARSPKYIFERVVKDFPLVSKISTQELVELSDQSCTLRYSTTKPESRLFCLSRQGSDMAVPTVWGLPKAKLRETTCVARGDAYCEYHLSWHRPQRYSWPLMGLLAGIAAFAVGYVINPALSPYVLTVAVTLPLLAHLINVRKTNHANLDFSDQMTEDTRALLYADAEARQEILELNARQLEWDRIAAQRRAEAVTERQALVEQLEGLQGRLATAVRGYGHDINTPLTVLKTHSSILQKGRDTITEAELEEILRFNDEAVEKINLLVREMMAMAKTQKSLKAVVPEKIDVGELAGQLHRRARALVHGRPIEAVMRLRGAAPAAITTDRLMLDRIADNLLMNAAKYTETGSVEIVVGEQDGALTLEVRDTGRGIAPADLPQIFEPEGSDAATRKAGSFGLGLSVVTQLLAQLGGRLEVQSELDQGSSFNVILPTDYQPPGEEEIPSSTAVVSY